MQSIDNITHNFSLNSSNVNINEFIMWLKQTKPSNVNKEEINTIIVCLMKTIKENFNFLNEDEQMGVVSFFLELKSINTETSLSLNDTEEVIKAIIGYIYMLDISNQVKEKISLLLSALLRYYYQIDPEKGKGIIFNIVNDVYIKMEEIKDSKVQNQDILDFGYLLSLSSVTSFLSQFSQIFDIFFIIVSKYQNKKNFYIIEKVSYIIFEILSINQHFFDTENENFFNLILLCIQNLNQASFILLRFIYTKSNIIEKSSPCYTKFILNILIFFCNPEQDEFIQQFTQYEDRMVIVIEFYRQCFNFDYCANEIRKSLDEFYNKRIFPIFQYYSNKLSEDQYYLLHFNLLVNQAEPSLASSIYNLLIYLCIKYDDFCNAIFEKCFDSLSLNHNLDIISLILANAFRQTYLTQIIKTINILLQEISNQKLSPSLLFLLFFIIIKDSKGQAGQIFEVFLKVYKNQTIEIMDFLTIKIYELVGLKNERPYLFSPNNSHLVEFNCLSFPKKFQKDCVLKFFPEKQRLIDYFQYLINTYSHEMKYDDILLNNSTALLDIVAPNDEQGQSLLDDFYELLARDKLFFYFRDNGEKQLIYFAIYLINRITEKHERVLQDLEKYITKMVERKVVPIQINFEYMVICLNNINQKVMEIPLIDSLKNKFDDLIVSEFQLVKKEINLAGYYYDFILLILSIFPFSESSMGLFLKTFINYFTTEQADDFAIIKQIICFHFIQINIPINEVLSIVSVQKFAKFYNAGNFTVQRFEMISKYEIIVLIYSFIRTLREVNDALFQKQFCFNFISFLANMFEYFTKSNNNKNTVDEYSLDSLKSYFHSRYENQIFNQLEQKKENLFYGNYYRFFFKQCSKNYLITKLMEDYNVTKDVNDFIISIEQKFPLSIEYMEKKQFIINNISYLAKYLQSIKSRKIIRIKGR